MALAKLWILVSHKFTAQTLIIVKKQYYSQEIVNFQRRKSGIFQLEL
ncbi:hypothetical protein CCACVL1_28267 [Corchorus capsularis]|uniref:Uncharacterized protein n=1 Tax=Corchorus capsularis TaxID=210143 RepID=A0A1R3G754_COCAP|nr:hypothetical protein CCACVL1_28267 [Corchorus capsularis]